MNSEPPVQIIGNSGHPERHTLVAGDDLILECEVSRPSATVQWLHNGKILKPGNCVTIDRCDVVRKLVLSGLQPSDSGTYICDAIDDQLVTVVEVQGKFNFKRCASFFKAFTNYMHFSTTSQVCE